MNLNHIGYISFVSVLATSPVYAGNIGELIGKSENWLKCDTSNYYEKAVCKYASIMFENELAKHNLKLRNGWLAWSGRDVTGLPNKKKGCTKAKVSHDSLDVRYDTRDLDIAFKGDMMDQVIRLHIPTNFEVDFDARIKEKQRTRIFGNCSDPSSTDHYNLVAKTTINGYATLTFSNEATLDEDNENFYVTIQPVMQLNHNLDRFDLDFKVKGRNNFGMLFHSLTNLVTNFDFDIQNAMGRALFKGQIGELYSYETWKYTIVDTGQFIASAALSYDEIAEDPTFQKFVSNYAETKVVEYYNDAKEGKRQDAEAKLAYSLKESLNLDDQGKRKFSISKGKVYAPIVASAITPFL